MEVKTEPCDVNDIDASNSSGSKDLGKTLPEEAFNNFLQGKRHILVRDYSFAVQSLATACELYVKHFGELAIECGEVYFLYGKALFRLYQQQAGFLGGALNEDGEDEENEAEGEGAEGEENEAETEGNEDEAEKEEKEPSESTDSPPALLDEGSSEVKVKVEQSDSADITVVAVKQEPEDSSADDQTAQSEDGKPEGSEENQEVEEDDLELAWNTLETAKSIFKRKDTVEAQLKVADILYLLAEISMESDNNANAIKYLEDGLKIKKKHLKPDDRILAETYYQMGLALMLDKKYPEALENFRETRKILELRRENLEKTPVIEPEGTFAKAEIEDLSSTLLDIKEKIDDTEELITNKKKELEESSFGEPSMSGSSIVRKTVITKPVSNTTHLLKRKKPEEALTSEVSLKRIKSVSQTRLPEIDVPVSKASKTENSEQELLLFVEKDLTALRIKSLEDFCNLKECELLKKISLIRKELEHWQSEVLDYEEEINKIKSFSTEGNQEILKQSMANKEEKKEKVPADNQQLSSQGPEWKKNDSLEEQKEENELLPSVMRNNAIMKLEEKINLLFSKFKREEIKENTEEMVKAAKEEKKKWLNLEMNRLEQYMEKNASCSEFYFEEDNQSEKQVFNEIKDFIEMKSPINIDSLAFMNSMQTIKFKKEAIEKIKSVTSVPEIKAKQNIEKKAREEAQEVVSKIQ